jgi:hypothetical protein
MQIPALYEHDAFNSRLTPEELLSRLQAQITGKKRPYSGAIYGTKFKIKRITRGGSNVIKGRITSTGSGSHIQIYMRPQALTIVLLSAFLCIPTTFIVLSPLIYYIEMNVIKNKTSFFGTLLASIIFVPFIYMINAGAFEDEAAIAKEFLHTLFEESVL